MSAGEGVSHPSSSIYRGARYIRLFSASDRNENDDCVSFVFAVIGFALNAQNDRQEKFYGV